MWLYLYLHVQQQHDKKNDKSNWSQDLSHLGGCFNLTSVLNRNCKLKDANVKIALGVNGLYGLGQVIFSLDCTMNIIIAIQTKWCKRVSWN